MVLLTTLCVSLVKLLKLLYCVRTPACSTCSRYPNLHNVMFDSYQSHMHAWHAVQRRPHWHHSVRALGFLPSFRRRCRSMVMYRKGAPTTYPSSRYSPTTTLPSSPADDSTSGMKLRVTCQPNPTVGVSGGHGAVCEACAARLRDVQCGTPCRTPGRTHRTRRRSPAGTTPRTRSSEGAAALGQSGRQGWQCRTGDVSSPPQPTLAKGRRKTCFLRGALVNCRLATQGGRC